MLGDNAKFGMLWAIGCRESLAFKPADYPKAATDRQILDAGLRQAVELYFYADQAFDALSPAVDDIQPDHQCWDAGMAMDLQAPAASTGTAACGVAASSDITRSLDAIRSHGAPPLFVEWPSLFDF